MELTDHNLRQQGVCNFGSEDAESRPRRITDPTPLTPDPREHRPDPRGPKPLSPDLNRLQSSFPPGTRLRTPGPVDPPPRQVERDWERRLTGGWGPPRRRGPAREVQVVRLGEGTEGVVGEHRSEVCRDLRPGGV